MPDPKKPTAIEQMVEILKSMVTEPISDQSSRPATAQDVRNVRAAMATPRPKAAPKAKAKVKAKAKAKVKAKAKTKVKPKAKAKTKAKAKRKTARK